MSLRLKSLELHGYKTFANRTVFEFAAPITVIVGPNGSGKSNIADSLRWVLGEQSYSLLRGKKTEDMIFSGSEQRPRAGMASATVVFDNSEGWLPIDFSEVAITRRAYRDGENEYLINGQRVRLRDVTELLARSGLAERTYTIIGQGLVDTALSLRAEERRRLFEEAAGIGLYRSRREEALRRLEITQRNLERAQDILAELQPRLHSLERQARRAQEYEQLRIDLRALLRDWYGYHWHLAQKELSRAIELVRHQESVLSRVRQEQMQLDEQLTALRNRVQQIRTQLHDWHRQQSELHKQREDLSRQRVVVDERLRSLAEQWESLRVEKKQLEEELGVLQERLRQSEAEVQRLQNELEETKLRAEETRLALQLRQAERAKIEENLRNAQQAFVALQTRKEQLRLRHQEIVERIRQHQGSLEKLSQSLIEAETHLQHAKEKARLHEDRYRIAEEARREAEQSLGDHRLRLSEAETSLRQLHETGATLAAEVGRLQAQLDVLEKAEADLRGYSRGAQVLMRAARASHLKGARGILSAYIEVPAEVEVAVSAVLGEYLEAIIIDDGEHSDTALHLLNEASARGVLLPLSDLTPPAHQEDLLPQNMSGVLGWASDLVNAPQELSLAVELLLSRTLIVRDRQTARLALRHFATSGMDVSGFRAVTLEGEVFYATGQILAGREGNQTPLSLARQRRTLRAEVKKFESQMEKIDEELQQGNQYLQTLRDEEARLENALEQARGAEQQAFSLYNQVKLAVEAAQRQVQWLIERKQGIQREVQVLEAEASSALEVQAQVDKQMSEAEETLHRAMHELQGLSLDEHQSLAEYWKTQEAVTFQALSHAISNLEERRTAFARLQQTLTAHEKKLGLIADTMGDLENEQANLRQAEAQLSAQIEAVYALINPAEEELAMLEQEQERLQLQEATARQNVAKAEHHHAQARIALARQQEALETWRRRIEDDFGLVAFEYSEEVSGPTPLPLEGMVEQLPRHRELPPELEDNIHRLRAQLRRLGPVNAEAQAEYQEVKQRYEFMTTQVEDLKRAEDDVRQIIAELDEMMQQQLRKTFEAVADEFTAIFKRLFNGGSARLVLTEPEDMTHTGIDIEARLPGRRTQGLSLLSGGERSLTATALIFALLKVSPVPFCLLDEVDAMLDEANVGRFSELLRELSQHTQFIVVTHNRNTVQVADVIYGVTMGRDSSSQVISLKMDEVEKVVAS